MPASRADPDENETLNENECRVVDSISRLGSQWRLVVIYDIQHSEKRFNELKRSTDASSRTLSRTLDALQEVGFISRRLEEDSPVATYYRLTGKGESLCPVFEEL
jgi:DNA-binding HxlR family transcriptional regulator